MSADGSILGTAAYMSPEQALGKGVDKRTDIWAFGCVLFEMLTGSRAFAGVDVKVTLGSVLQNQPSFENLPSSVPPAVRTLLQRCLEKDRTRRVADAATLVYVLDQAASLAPPIAGAQARSTMDSRRCGGSNRRRRPAMEPLAFTFAGGGCAVWALDVRWSVDDHVSDSYCGVAGWFATGLLQQWAGVPP
jgi:serine/threonine protein kinase